MSSTLGKIRCIAAVGLVACKNEQELAELKFEAIAVSTGDFDQVEAALARMDIGYTPYDGYTVQAVYDPTIPMGTNALVVEDLFTRVTDNVPEIEAYDAVFVNSGTRGLGAYVYNSTLPDDSVVTNTTAVDTVRSYVENGGTLIVSDWAYDLIEAAWPDQITWAGDDLVLDDAQRGLDTEIVAKVNDEALSEALDNNTTLNLVFDYTYWTVISTVSADTTVYLSGDVNYRVSDAVGEGQLTDVPLLVGFKVSGGTVLFSAFPWRAQKDLVANAMLRTLIEGLDPGSGDSTGSDTGGGS